MGVYIKGMEMPKTCHCCRMCVQVSDGDIDWHWECCLLCERVARYAADRISGCPLVPVPPHGRLKDADALIKSLSLDEDDTENGASLLMAIFLEVLKAAPTIIEAEEGE